MPETDLQKRFESLARRVLDDVEAWERNTRDNRREAVKTITQEITTQISSAIAKERDRKHQEGMSRRARRAERRAQKRAEKRQDASTVGGVVWLLMAAAMVLFVLLRPEMWWLIFAAMGPAAAGAEELRLVQERRELHGELPASTTAAPPDQVHEVDAICDQLLSDLKSAPEAVRQFIQDPQKTIGAMRTAAKALDTRRQQLLGERPHERLAQLPAQRQALLDRQASTVDEVARLRLAEALTSLDAQRSALEALARAADRADGEYTSLLVSLQELRTRVSLARTAGTAVQLDGLKQSLTRLNGELEAISDALESVSSGRLEPVAEIDQGLADPGQAPVRVRR